MAIWLSDGAIMICTISTGNAMMTRKLTEQQRRRVNNLQQKRLKQTKETTAPSDDTQLGSPQKGLLIMRHARNLLVEAESGQLYTCHFRQNLADPVPGDHVIWREDANGSGVVEAIEPRQSVFYKIISNTPGKPLAANVTCLAIVMAPEPLPSAELLDKYLVAAELEHFTPLIIFNKIDLVTDDRAPLISMTHHYQQLGYNVMSVSTRTGAGMAELKQQLARHTTIFVGQSGVGKSSLVNYLLPEEELRVSDVSAISRLGRHTTSDARLYHLPGGGNIIDSAGVRDVALGDVSRQQIHEGFIELRPYIGQCKFRDCHHIHEPGCAIKGALEQAKISKARYDSFMQLLEGHK